MLNAGGPLSVAEVIVRGLVADDSSFTVRVIGVVSGTFPNAMLVELSVSAGSVAPSAVGPVPQASRPATAQAPITVMRVRPRLPERLVRRAPCGSCQLWFDPGPAPSVPQAQSFKKEKLISLLDIPDLFHCVRASVSPLLSRCRERNQLRNGSSAREDQFLMNGWLLSTTNNQRDTAVSLALGTPIRHHFY
jgi:hypothetical protein